MDISISITELNPKNMGEEVELKIAVSVPESPEKTEIKAISIYSKMLFEIGNIGVGSLPYPLKKEEYDAIEYSGELTTAVKKAIDLLAFGDNTARSIVNKLRARGFDKYIAEDAAEYLVKAKYIDEAGHLTRVVNRLSEVNLYGKMRIKSEIAKKGFSRDVIAENLEDLLSQIDFEENAFKLLEKKCDTGRLSDYKYRQSLYAAMYRYGYSSSETKAGISRIKANID